MIPILLTLGFREITTPLAHDRERTADRVREVLAGIVRL